jgi:hypothetical protein
MAILDVGCCGAYCGTCPAFTQNACRGCKHGYATGERDLARAKCAMKVCCLGRTLPSCADCADYETCAALRSFYQKPCYKYQKYCQATAFIRAHGYDAFVRIADGWKNAYGRCR